MKNTLSHHELPSKPHMMAFLPWFNAGLCETACWDRTKPKVIFSFLCLFNYFVIGIFKLVCQASTLI